MSLALFPIPAGMTDCCAARILKKRGKKQKFPSSFVPEALFTVWTRLPAVLFCNRRYNANVQEFIPVSCSSNKNNTAVKKQEEKEMRRYTGFILFFAFLMLLVPLLAMFGQNPDPAQPFFPSGTVSAITGGLTSEDYEQNRFYLVQNHLTQEVMALTPVNYIKGVVAAEMPISYHSEALKAQAVAAHTYALTQIDNQLQHPDSSLGGAYLSTDPDHFQAYLSQEERKELWGKYFDVYEEKLTQAVEAVIGEVLTYEEKPIIAAFHSLSSGRTESAQNVWGQDVAYLKPVESEGDLLSPSYETAATLTKEEVGHALTEQFPGIQLPEDAAGWFQIGRRSDSGTVLELSAAGQTMTGQELRELLHLKSADFTVAYENDVFTFTAIGYGHGVGMSQYGADYLARQGKSYADILLHYYTGVELTALSA